MRTFWHRIRTLRLRKRWPVRILSAVTLVLLLGCAIRMMFPDRSWHVEGAYAFTPGNATQMSVVYSGICLEPGVYYVELEYEAEYEGPGAVAYTTMQDGTVITGGLCTNGEHLYGGMGKSGYHMWLYEGTEDMQMTVSYGGNGQLKLTGYTIRETDQFWTMWMAIIAGCYAFGFGALIYHYYDKEFLVSEEKKKIFFFVSLIGFAASLPYFLEGNLAGIDLTYHLQRIEGVKDGLLSGRFPVRIEPEWLYGHGYAAGIFYCNSLLYIPALLRLLGFPVAVSYNIFCVGITFATAWIAWYCFRKIFDSANVGIFCCALYTLSTFRIYKLVNTSAVGEGSAVTFMPLVLYGMWRVFTEDPEEEKYKTAWIPVAAGYAGLIQTHVLTCEITAFITVIVCVACVKKLIRKNVFLELAKGALGAVGISLWFLTPFLDYYLTQDMHIKHLSARTIQRTGMTFAHLAFHFWKNGSFTPNGETGVYDTHPVGVGFVLVLGLCLFAALGFGGYLRQVKGAVKQLAVAAAAMGTLLLFMSTNLFPWDGIRAWNPVFAALVSSLEFTHRVLGWGNIFLVTVCGFCLWFWERNNRRCYWMAGAVVVLCVITSGMHLIDYVSTGWEEVVIYNEEGMGAGFVSDEEYLIEGTDVGRLTFGGIVAGEGISVEEYEKKSLGAIVRCVNTENMEGYVELPLLYYKGYRAMSDTGAGLTVRAGENNVVRVCVPAGFADRIEVRFVSPLYWRISEIISAGFAIGGFCILLRKVRWKKA